MRLVSLLHYLGYRQHKQLFPHRGVCFSQQKKPCQVIEKKKNKTRMSKVQIYRKTRHVGNFSSLNYNNTLFPPTCYWLASSYVDGPLIKSQWISFYRNDEVVKTSTFTAWNAAGNRSTELTNENREFSNACGIKEKSPNICEVHVQLPAQISFTGCADHQAEAKVSQTI